MMSSSTDHESKPFLDGSDDGHDLERDDLRQTRKRSFHGILFCIHFAFLTFNILVFAKNFITLGQGQTLTSELEAPYSPADIAIQYKVETADTHPYQSPFVGNPRPGVDQAWSNLLRSSMIKLSEDEMRKMNKTSVVLRDGSGYIGYMETIHMLHCVKRFYQAQHPEHYPELAKGDAFTPGHWDHCLEVLRQGIMCNADTSINTYFWKNDQEIKGNRAWSRKCTDWNHFEAWAHERAVDFHGEEAFMETLVPRNQEGSIGPL